MRHHGPCEKWMRPLRQHREAIIGGLATLVVFGLFAMAVWFLAHPFRPSTNLQALPFDDQIFGTCLRLVGGVLLLFLDAGMMVYLWRSEWYTLIGTLRNRSDRKTR